MAQSKAIEFERQSFRWSWASTRVDGSFLNLNRIPKMILLSFLFNLPIANEEKAKFNENSGQHYTNCGPINFWVDSVLNNGFQRLDNHLDTGNRHYYRNNYLNLKGKLNEKKNNKKYQGNWFKSSAANWIKIWI